MRDYFEAMATILDGAVIGPERYRCWFAAEATDFVRFNHSAIRQAGHVRQVLLTLELIDGQRHASTTITLGGALAADAPLLVARLAALRTLLPELPEDPHLQVSGSVCSSTRITPADLPATAVMVDTILAAAAATDMVGILASGPIWRGFADAEGQLNWHESRTFNLDWSLYLDRDKAVKSSYAGGHWRAAEFQQHFAAAVARLALLQRAPVTVPPGAYRAYLAPAALNEIISMLNWGAVAEKSLQTRASALRRMRDEGVRLHPAIHLRENTAEGLAPAFQADGFVRPPSVTLIDAGVLAGSMISPRSAAEYGLLHNGADADESMRSIDLAAGELDQADALAQLGTGIWISNLWYLNFSDRGNCRITGMTRFATFWVEDGAIVAPLNVMRFDDSLFELLGDNLLALTRERELLVANDTYLERSTASARLPGALVKDFRFVL